MLANKKALYINNNDPELKRIYNVHTEHSLMRLKNEVSRMRIDGDLFKIGNNNNIIGGFHGTNFTTTKRAFLLLHE